MKRQADPEWATRGEKDQELCQKWIMDTLHSSLILAEHFVIYHDPHDLQVISFHPHNNPAG